MPHRHFEDMSNIATLLAFIAGSWGAVIAFSRRNKKRLTAIQLVMTFLMDMFINIGITMLVYLGLVGYGINDLLSVAISGFVGHQGTRSFYLIELIITEKLGAQRTYNILRDEEKELTK